MIPCVEAKQEDRKEEIDNSSLLFFLSFFPSFLFLLPLQQLNLQGAFCWLMLLLNCYHPVPHILLVGGNPGKTCSWRGVVDESTSILPVFGLMLLSLPSSSVQLTTLVGQQPEENKIPVDP